MKKMREIIKAKKILQDPFSTPARRRRIIADVSKGVLRQYCLTACDNVLKYRAAIIIQCLFRRSSAIWKVKRLLFQRKTRAAITIQCCWRIKRAHVKLKQRRAELRLKRAIKLSRFIRAMWLRSKEKVHRREIRLLQQLARLKRWNKAAIEIQRVYRGYRGRLLFQRRFQEAYRRQVARMRAARLIQSIARKRIACRVVHERRQRRYAAVAINRRVLLWWHGCKKGNN